MTNAPDAPNAPYAPAADPPQGEEEARRRYVQAVRDLLAHGGYERSGDPQDARRWRIDHVRALLDTLGHPDRRRTVHVAGSKGKGSTATMVESILRAAGQHTLLLTSPDVHAARERIAIDGTPLDHATFAALTERLLREPATRGWSYFELLTVLGWIAGAEAGCEWQVVEVGLGGRLDTTNAVHSKEVAVITPIDLEHTAILGDTIPQVAAEKAGIITGPCEVVAAPMRTSALEVVRARAAEMGARLHTVADECRMTIARQDLRGQVMDLRTPQHRYRGLTIPLIGRHQAENAATAVLAAELALAASGQTLPAEAVRDGLTGARAPGRFEVIRQRPTVIVDALHTPLAARRVRETLDAVRPPQPHMFVLGLLDGKDLTGVAAALLREGETVIVAPPASSRAAPPEEVVDACLAAGAVPQRAATVAAAIDRALELVDGASRPGSAPGSVPGSVIVAGSLYTASEAREHLLGVVGDRDLGLR